MTANGDGTTKREEVAVWCGSCGIPYAAGTVYCTHCGATLIADAPLPAVPGLIITPAVSPTREDDVPALAAAPPEQIAVEQHMSISLGPAMPTTSNPPLGQAFPNAPRGLLDRVRQRQRAMSDDEVDAAAAAIIAQARSAGELVGGGAVSPDNLPPLTGFLPDFATDEALQRRQERERFWLIAGIVCSVLLILFALAVSRYLSIGLLRR